MNRSSRAASVALVVFLLGRNAVAGEGETERARALFEEAGELERHGQWGAAQERLRAALRLRETPQLYYALGWALENDDKLLEAKVEYETAARLGRERPGGEEAARLANARLAELDRKMPIIKVRVGGGGKASARVVVDGREIKREDDVATTPVNPGSHVIRVERGSDGAVEQMVYVGRSTIRTVEVDAGELVAVKDNAQDRHGKAAVRAATTTTKGADGERRDVLPWLLLSGGIAFAAGGTALLISAASDAEARDDAQGTWCMLTACNGVTATRTETAEAAAFRREASDAASTGNTKQAFGLALGGIGLVSATVGAILLLRDGPTKERHVTRAKASASPLPGGGFASATFSF